MSELTRRKDARSTLLVMICTLVSRILGFVRTAAVGALFGAGGAADVINLVFSIPNNLRKLLAEGALSAAFIPELSREITRDSNAARGLAARIIGLQFAVILPILGVSLIFPRQVLTVFEQFDDPGKTALSIPLFRQMMPYLLLVSVSAVMMAVLNTHGQFTVPGLTPIVFSICVIASLLIGYRRWGALSMGWGVLAGGIAQIAIQYPAFRALGYPLVPIFQFRNPAFRTTMKRWGPMLLTSSLFAVNSQIAMLLASFLPDGSASALSYAIVFFQLPFGIFSASITTVLYPRMSRQAARGERAALMESLEFGYRGLWALLLPSAMILIVLGEPIIAAAFQRGAFSAADTILTARVLTAYALGMPFVGLFNITQRAFYALGEVRKPFYCALAAAAADITLSLVFIFIFNMGSTAPAWANSWAFIFAAVLQYLVLRRKIGFSIGRRTRRGLIRTSLAAAAGIAVILLAVNLPGRQWWSSGAGLRTLGILTLITAPGCIVILALYIWMKVEVVSILSRGGRRR